MRKIFRRRLAVLLAAALMMSSTTLAYAEELVEAGTTEEQEADVVEVDDAAIEEVTEAAEAEIYEDKKTVSDPTADPETWGKDLYNASYTYMLYLPELLGLEDRDMVSSDWISNNKHIDKEEITGDDIWDAVKRYKANNTSPQGFNINSISFDCIHIEGDYYVVYAYGIDNDFDGSVSDYYNNVVKLGGDPTDKNLSPDISAEALSPSRNNYYGLDQTNKPAGVFDYTPFSWYGKSAGVGGNGKIICEAAVIKWSNNGKKAEKDRIFKLDKLCYKNNRIYATVSFCAVDGQWKKVSNYKFLKKEPKQPSFYPKFKVKKSYRDIEGNKIKPDKDQKKANKKLLKSINNALKDHKIEYEIRRRPVAATTSTNYILEDDWRYTSLIGDDLEFKKNGKLKTGKLQFKSRASVKEKDIESDSSSGEEEEAGSGNSSAQVAEYYLTHTLKIDKIPDKDTKTDANFIKEMEAKIKADDYKQKRKTDAWFTTRKIDGDDTLIVIGAKNLEGVAAFRCRKDKTIGKGYYESDTDCFITGLDE